MRFRDFACHLGLVLFALVHSSSAMASCTAANPNSSLPETTPTSAFTDNGDGTVTHALTGLTWKRCAEGQVWSGGTCNAGPVHGTWSDALGGAKNSNFAGYADWRLPNLKELQSIVEGCGFSPAINLNVFYSTVAAKFWSSSPVVGGSVAAWVVDFANGATLSQSRSVSASVRLVRGGQSMATFDRLAPTAPLSPSTTPGNGQAWVSFAPPLSNSGSAITGYTANCTPSGGGTAGASAPSIYISRLRNDVLSSCDIRATNIQGAGLPLTVSLTTHATALALDDTGQSTCYDGATILACSAANTGNSTAYRRQDGRFGRDAAATASVLTKTGTGNAGFDFTKMCNSGQLAGSPPCPADPVQGSGSNDWGCTKDNVTGMVWLVETIAGIDWTYATETYPAAANTAHRCGFSNGWWLPTAAESLSIVDLGASGYVIDQNYFPGSGDYCYWVWTASAATRPYTLLLAPDVGNNCQIINQSTSVASPLFHARLVHPPALASVTRYMDHGDGTVSDTTTGLMWDKCAWSLSGSDCGGGTAQTGSWSQALGMAISANAIKHNGYGDWRLPNIKELESLVDSTQGSVFIDGSVFPATPAQEFWSASRYPYDPHYALAQSFADGSLLTRSTGTLLNARLVRGGRGYGAFDLLAPLAPTIDTAMAANGKVTVSFTPAANGPVATTFTASCSDGSNTRGVLGSTYQITVDQLTNGVTYACSVTAANSEGSSLASATLNATPHATAPDAPALLRLIPGDQSIKVVFAPSASNGGSNITGYVATCTGGGSTHTSSPPALASPIKVTGLTNNVSYTCSVHASNDIGSSGESTTAVKVAKRTSNIAPILGIMLGD